MTRKVQVVIARARIEYLTIKVEDSENCATAVIKSALASPEGAWTITGQVTKPTVLSSDIADYEFGLLVADVEHGEGTVVLPKVIGGRRSLMASDIARDFETSIASTNLRVSADAVDAAGPVEVPQKFARTFMHTVAAVKPRD